MLSWILSDWRPGRRAPAKQVVDLIRFGGNMTVAPRWVPVGLWYAPRSGPVGFRELLRGTISTAVAAFGCVLLIPLLVDRLNGASSFAIAAVAGVVAYIVTILSLLISASGERSWLMRSIWCGMHGFVPAPKKA